MGTEGLFGPLCLVITDPETPPADALAVFPGDSAQRYTTGDGSINEPRAVAEATAWRDRAALALIERWSEALGTPAAHWPSIVCRADHYLEVARAGLLSPASLAEVRLRTSLRDRLADLEARLVSG